MSNDPWAEFTPVEKKADDPWSEFTPVEQPGTLGTIVNALRYGASQTLSGPAATLNVQGADGPIGSTAQSTLNSAANMVAPQDYAPASERVANKNLPLWERVKALPRALLESSPGMAQDIAAGWAGGEAGGLIGLAGGPFAEVTAPVGAAIGGLGGFAGSYLLRNFGNDARGSANSRTGDANAAPNAEDKQRALEAGLAGAALSRLGLKGAGGAAATAAGGSAVGQVAKQAVLGAGLDAATSGVSDAIRQDLIDRTQQTPSDALVSALGGAGTGLAVRATTGVKDVANASRFKDIEKSNPDSAARVANALEDTSTPKTSFDSINKLSTRLRSDLDESSKDSYIGPQLKALGPTDDTTFLLSQLKDQARQGIPVDQSDIDTLKGRIGHTAEGQKLTSTLEDLNTVNQLKGTGDFNKSAGTFAGGLQTSPLVKALSPIGSVGGKLEAANAIGTGLSALGYGARGHYMMGFDPTGLGVGLAAAHVGAYAGIRGLDALTGAANPADGFKTRFADPNLAPAPQAPSFRQGLADDAQAKAAAEQKLRDLGRTAALMQRSQALAQQQSDQALKGPAFTSKMMTADAANQAKASALLARTVQQAEAAKAAREQGSANAEAAAARQAAKEQQAARNQQYANIRQTANIMRNSEGASASDAAMPLRVARLKAQLEAAAEKEQAAALGATGNPNSAPKQQAQRPQSAPQAPLDPHKYITLSDGGDHTVQRTTEGVMNTDRYKAGGDKRMQARTQAVFAAHEELGSHAAALNSMLRDMNRNATTRAEGKRLMEEHLKDMPQDVQAIVRKHIDKDDFWQTWKKAGK